MGFKCSLFKDIHKFVFICSGSKANDLLVRLGEYDLTTKDESKSATVNVDKVSVDKNS